MNNNRLPARIPRRRFVAGGASAVALANLGGCASPSRPEPAHQRAPVELRGKRFDLHIDYLAVNITGIHSLATAVNGSLPAPTLRWKEGEEVHIRVHNHLRHTSSIHWHGLILPTAMDGVPGLSFAGIAPGSYYDYRFVVRQSGSYWYHSHSGFQEQTGLYGAIIIDPAEPDPIAFDREHVVMLSDWSDEAPEQLYARLKKYSHYYNRRERTAADLWQDLRTHGLAATWRDRAMWNRMRMSDSDIADINGIAYTFLVNGHSPDANWRGDFAAGERLRLRVINAAAMTLFDFRIPGLKMTVVAADGQAVQAVSVDELRIAPAETYDVIIEPSADRAYTLFAQSIDRSGYARATLSPSSHLEAAIPAMDHPPRLGHRDMGMAHTAGSHHNSSHHASDHRPETGHSGHVHHGMASHHLHSLIAPAGAGSTSPIQHRATEYGPGVDMRANKPQSGLDDPGIGLRDHAQRYGRRVLRYRDLVGLLPTRDRRDPEREVAIHLTGNMSRYMWSINGRMYEDSEPIVLRHNERLRFVVVNDTMMTHPVHLHGLWSELETGEASHIPRKHTVIVQPGSRISYLVSADAIGRWAYHCHLMFHMPGMFREVRVVG